MKVTYPSTCRRKHQQQNSHKIRQRFCTAFLSFLFLLSCFVSVNASQVAADPSDEIVNSFSFHASGFRIGIVNNPLENLNVYGYDSTAPYYFTRYAADYNITRASYRCYVDYVIDSDISAYSDEKYVLIESSLAYGMESVNNLINNGRSYYYFYDIDGNIIQAQVPADREIEVITVEFQGTDFSLYKNYLVYKVEDLSSWVSEIYRISFNQYFDSMGNGLVPFLFTDLSLKFYNTFEDVAAEINNNLQVIQNQNNIIINNLTDVKNQLNTIHNNLTSNVNPNNPDLDNKFDDANSIEEDFQNNFNEFVDPDIIDSTINKFSDFFVIPKVSAAFVFIRSIFNSAFLRVQPLGILFSAGTAVIIVGTLFGIVSRFSRPSDGEHGSGRDSYYDKRSSIVPVHFDDIWQFTQKSDGSWGP